MQSGPLYDELGDGGENYVVLWDAAGSLLRRHNKAPKRLGDAKALYPAKPPRVEVDEDVTFFGRMLELNPGAPLRQRFDRLSKLVSVPTDQDLGELRTKWWQSIKGLVIDGGRDDILDPFLADTLRSGKAYEVEKYRLDRGELIPDELRFVHLATQQYLETAIDDALSSAARDGLSQSDISFLKSFFDATPPRDGDRDSPPPDVFGDSFYEYQRFDDWRTQGRYTTDVNYVVGSSYPTPARRGATNPSVLVNAAGSGDVLADYYARGRDPLRSWGLDAQRQGRAGYTGIPGRDFALVTWACCGEPASHPGCWVTNNPDDSRPITPFTVADPRFPDWATIAIPDDVLASADLAVAAWRRTALSGDIWDPDFSGAKKLLIAEASALVDDVAVSVNNVVYDLLFEQPANFAVAADTLAEAIGDEDLPRFKRLMEIQAELNPEKRPLPTTDAAWTDYIAEEVFSLSTLDGAYPGLGQFDYVGPVEVVPPMEEDELDNRDPIPLVTFLGQRPENWTVYLAAEHAGSIRIGKARGYAAFETALPAAEAALALMPFYPPLGYRPTPEPGIYGQARMVLALIDAVQGDRDPPPLYTRVKGIVNYSGVKERVEDAIRAEDAFSKGVLGEGDRVDDPTARLVALREELTQRYAQNDEYLTEPVLEQLVAYVSRLRRERAEEGQDDAEEQEQGDPAPPRPGTGKDEDVDTEEEDGDVDGDPGTVIPEELIVEAERYQRSVIRNAIRFCSSVKGWVAESPKLDERQFIDNIVAVGIVPPQNIRDFLNDKTKFPATNMKMSYGIDLVELWATRWQLMRACSIMLSEAVEAAEGLFQRDYKKKVNYKAAVIGEMRERLFVIGATASSTGGVPAGFTSFGDDPKRIIRKRSPNSNLITFQGDPENGTVCLDMFQWYIGQQEAVYGMLDAVDGKVAFQVIFEDAGSRPIIIGWREVFNQCVRAAEPGDGDENSNIPELDEESADEEEEGDASEPEQEEDERGADPSAPESEPEEGEDEATADEEGGSEGLDDSEDVDGPPGLEPATEPGPEGEDVAPQSGPGVEPAAQPGNEAVEVADTQWRDQFNAATIPTEAATLAETIDRMAALYELAEFDDLGTGGGEGVPILGPIPSDLYRRASVLAEEVMSWNNTQAAIIKPYLVKSGLYNDDDARKLVVETVGLDEIDDDDLGSKNRYAMLNLAEPTDETFDTLKLDFGLTYNTATCWLIVIEIIRRLTNKEFFPIHRELHGYEQALADVSSQELTQAARRRILSTINDTAAWNRQAGRLIDAAHKQNIASAEDIQEFLDERNMELYGRKVTKVAAYSDPNSHAMPLELVDQEGVPTVLFDMLCQTGANSSGRPMTWAQERVANWVPLIESARVDKKDWTTWSRQETADFERTIEAAYQRLSYEDARAIDRMIKLAEQQGVNSKYELEEYSEFADTITSRIKSAELTDRQRELLKPIARRVGLYIPDSGVLSYLRSNASWVSKAVVAPPSETKAGEINFAQRAGAQNQAFLMPDPPLVVKTAQCWYLLGRLLSAITSERFLGTAASEGIDFYRDKKTADLIRDVSAELLKEVSVERRVMGPVAAEPATFGLTRVDELEVARTWAESWEAVCGDMSTDEYPVWEDWRTKVWDESVKAFYDDYEFSLVGDRPFYRPRSREDAAAIRETLYQINKRYGTAGIWNTLQQKTLGGVTDDVLVIPVGNRSVFDDVQEATALMLDTMDVMHPLQRDLFLRVAKKLGLMDENDRVYRGWTVTNDPGFAQMGISEYGDGQRVSGITQIMYSYQWDQLARYFWGLITRVPSNASNAEATKRALDDLQQQIDKLHDLNSVRLWAVDEYAKITGRDDRAPNNRGAPVYATNTRRDGGGRPRVVDTVEASIQTLADALVNARISPRARLEAITDPAVITWQDRYFAPGGPVDFLMRAARAIEPYRNAFVGDESVTVGRSPYMAFNMLGFYKNGALVENIKFMTLRLQPDESTLYLPTAKNTKFANSDMVMNGWAKGVEWAISIVKNAMQGRTPSSALQGLAEIRDLGLQYGSHEMRGRSSSKVFDHALVRARGFAPVRTPIIQIDYEPADLAEEFADVGRSPNRDAVTEQMLMSLRKHVATARKHSDMRETMDKYLTADDAVELGLAARKGDGSLVPCKGVSDELRDGYLCVGHAHVDDAHFYALCQRWAGIATMLSILQTGQAPDAQLRVAQAQFQNHLEHVDAWLYKGCEDDASNEEGLDRSITDWE